MNMEELEIYCPFCNGRYTAKMVEDLSSAEGCDTCGSAGESTGSIEIVCENCDKVVYKKEI